MPAVIAPKSGSRRSQERVAPRADHSVDRCQLPTRRGNVPRVRARVAALLVRYGDAVLASGLAAVGLIQVATLQLSSAERLAAAAGFLTLGAAAAVRSRYPEALAVGLLLLIPAGSVLPKRFGDIEAIGFFVLLAVYSLAAHTSGRRTIVGGALMFGVFVAALVGDPEEVNVAGVVFFAMVFGGPWVAGRAIRRRRLRESRLEREKQAAEAAIVEERARIARELHDVVAHAISVIVLHARAGRKVFDSKPTESRSAFDTIERTGAQALDEMRRLLGMLRAPDDEIALAPQPSLSQLDSLVERVRVAGLPVEVEVEGNVVELPPGVDLSAYRIVQEALTNALKHAGPARALVSIRYEADELILEITDDGTGVGNDSSTGHGLAGMKERVSVFGGQLEAGQHDGDGGGYALRARLPLASARP